MTARSPMPRRALRLLAAVLLSSGLLVAALAATAGAQSGGGVVVILEARGVLDRPVTDYLSDAIAGAQDGQADVLVLRLDSPGALKADVDALAARVADSRVPVVVWIPPGGQARGGAARVAMAAHLLVLSPGARLGPDAPADLVDGSPRGKGVLVVPDGRDPAAPLPDVVDRSTVEVVTESEAVARGVAAFTAPTLPDVLRELDQRTVEGGALESPTLEIDPVSADVRFENMGLGRRILHAVASPALAYLLLVGGALALVFEIFQPGFGVSGVSGLALMALGGYGFTVLPVRGVGLALLVGALAVLAVDLSIAGFGLLTALGAIGLTAGSLLLLDGPSELALSPWLIAFVVASTLIFFVVVMTVVLRAQAGQAQEGADEVVGKRAVVRSILNPEGHVFVDGALWRARAPEAAGKVKTGTVVRIVGLDDRLTLQVELEQETTTEKASTAQE